MRERKKEKDAYFVTKLDKQLKLHNMLNTESTGNQKRPPVMN